MKNSKKIILFILSIVCIIAFLFLISNIIRNKKFEKQSERFYRNVSNNHDTNELADNSLDENYIFFHEEETGEVRFQKSDLDKMKFEINGINDNIKSHIHDMTEFKNAIKEFIYKHGLIEASLGNVENWTLENASNKLLVYIRLNNNEKNMLLVSINLVNNAINIYKYE